MSLNPFPRNQRQPGMYLSSGSPLVIYVLASARPAYGHDKTINASGVQGLPFPLAGAMSRSATSTINPRTSDLTHPPTTQTQTLPDPERQRLVRSIRKIRAVFGEEPTVELAPAPPRTSSSSTEYPDAEDDDTAFLAPRPGFLYTQKAASASTLSLRSLSTPTPMPELNAHVQMQEHAPRRASAEENRHRHRRDHRPRPALVLRLPALSFEPLPFDLSATGSATSMLDLTSPLSSTFAPSPVTEDHASAKARTERRMRLAKVSRTLGESVPPALIVTAPAGRRRRRASMSVVTPGPESASFGLGVVVGFGAGVDEPDTPRMANPALQSRLRVEDDGMGAHAHTLRARMARRTSVVSFIDMGEAEVDAAGGSESDTTPATSALESPIGPDDVHVHAMAMASNTPSDDGLRRGTSGDAGPGPRAPSHYTPWHMRPSTSDSKGKGREVAIAPPLQPLPAPPHAASSAAARRVLPTAPSPSRVPLQAQRASAAFARYYDPGYDSDEPFPRNPTPRTDLGMFEYAPAPDAATYSYSRSATPAATERHERDWDGEWVTAGGGVSNMDEVVKQLRGLRVK